MVGLSRSRCAAWLALLAIPGLAFGQPPAKGALGLCPPGASRLDGYMQALCAGEGALQAGEPGTALERFRFAAALPRAEASNELAWAGLAATHCQLREFDAGRQWAAHYSQARRLWLGELDCDAAGDDPRAQLNPFVRSRMCSAQLTADYATVRGNPQAAYALELSARLQQIDAALAAACAASPPAQPLAQASGKAVKQGGKQQAAKKRTGSKPGSPTRGRTQNKPKAASERPASPAPER